jgi:hypothetical protein
MQPMHIRLPAKSQCQRWGGSRKPSHGESDGDCMRLVELDALDYLVGGA